MNDQEATHIELGTHVRDKITKLEGIVIAYTVWMYGCRRLVIQPFEVKDGKPADTYTIDEPQADIVKLPKKDAVREKRIKDGVHGGGRDDAAAARR